MYEYKLDLENLIKVRDSKCPGMKCNECPPRIRKLCYNQKRNIQLKIEYLKRGGTL